MKQAMMKKMDRFKDLTDEEIVRMAQEEHDAEATDYIVHKYRNFVKAKARSYFLIGADKEDIIQEGMVSAGSRDFRGDKQASFRAAPYVSV